MNYFGELLTAMVTPFNTDGSLSEKKAGDLAEILVNNKSSDGLVVSGTTGESPTLSFEEKLSLFQVVKDRLDGAGKVIAGTGSYNTKETIELTKEAEDIGVDGIMLVTPYYNKPTQPDLYNHFKSVAKETSLPIMLYNVPKRTGVDLEEKTIIDLSQINNIVCIKEASGDFNKITNIVKKTPDDFLVYSGDDVSLLPVLSVGGVGVVSVASQIVGEEIKELINVYKKDPKKALEIFQKLFPIFEALGVKTNPIPIKEAVNKHVMTVGPLRPPLYGLKESQLQIITEEYLRVKNI
ncbi:4-hydroxy-tetrahydrodipicolinate synthase [Natranaerobius trueperi]|uniref:4-hydroxy-tetrahydrodipicolinate synthase n=1 Tax=Natranaerobius trueperi TaxID=759412 RepID=A0A226BZT0_9FIRM|nr:4-hydroxy-tetrahydrodipicolinate synthase [Natranaerobius trueperi]OWZ84302.1 4-hydroxy-tetrahydrodipicolinate synthase [Natranaerobius trueperi]